MAKNWSKYEKNNNYENINLLQNATTSDSSDNESSNNNISNSNFNSNSNITFGNKIQYQYKTWWSRLTCKNINSTSCLTLKNCFYSKIANKLFQLNKKTKALIALITLITFLLIFGIFYYYICTHPHTNKEILEKIYVNHKSAVPEKLGYLVWSDQCKILSVDPYDPETIRYFTRYSYKPCTTDKPLTSLYYDDILQKYAINVNLELTLNYSEPFECCYQKILRNETVEKYADKEILVSKCFSFTESTHIPNTTDNILVKCKSQDKQVYIDGYPMIPEKHQVRSRLESWKKKNSKRPVSILMIGIDSVSRVNLIRAMPKTAQLLYDTDWFEMSGYNKIEDNTFPNLIGVLTGFNETTAFRVCEPKKVGGLDKCPIIWKTFRDNGYVTAYAEDESSINTFDYLKIGFRKPPVDYYFRPFLLAAEKYFPIQTKSGLTFCLGNKHSAEYVYDYAFEFAKRYRNEPYFGLFWTSTFSHNGLSDCSSMDVRMLEYVEKLSSSGILNESVVIFFSDHGMRFGPSLKYLSGYLEERLPFMFISLPPWLKIQHPDFVMSLRANKNRLTNHYDLHMTLKHLLELSGRVSNLPQAQDCPNCQTLLKPVPQNRTCEEIAITDHWCTCFTFKSIATISKPVKQIGQYIVNYLNDYVRNFQNGTYSDDCKQVELYKIVNAYKANLIGPKTISNIEEYKLAVQTTGGGIFEATIRRNSDNYNMELTGSISRINSYAGDSQCVSEEDLKKFCHCTNSTQTLN